MLSRINSSIVLALVACTSLVAGCLITSKPGSTDGGDTDNETGSGTTNPSSSSSSTGGGTGGGGDGGGNAGGSGGGEECVGPKGTGLDAKSCDNMNITPSSQGGPASSSCGEKFDEDPPGYGICQHAFEIFSAGPAENLQKCLAMITVEPANACDMKQVETCVNEMYEATCDDEVVKANCAQVGKDCAAIPEEFNVDTCSYQLKTLNDTAMEKYVACFNETVMTATCQESHDKCYTDLL